MGQININILLKNVYEPNCGANPSTRFLAEVREDGWLINRAFFNSEADARTWLENQDGIEMDKQTALEYLRMFKRYENK